VVGLLNSILADKPDALTFFETVGMKGIMQSHSPLYPDHFFAPNDMLYPIYYIFKIILENKSANFYHVKASHPSDFTGIAWGKDSPDTLLLVNFTLNSMKIELPDQFHQGLIFRLNENNFEMAMSDPDKFNSMNESHLGLYLDLIPFEIAMIKLF
jgi:hypothetical protein